MSSEDYSHLNKAATSALSLSDKERIKYLRSPRWIGYPRAKEILARLEDLLEYPKKHRMPNLLIVGNTNNGKSMIVNRFEQKHPAYDAINETTVKVPVLVIEAPPTPSESRFYNKILDRLFAPYKISDRPERKQTQVLTLLREIDTKVLVVDEIHNLLAGSSAKQREFLNVIKHLGNELQISIVGAGIKDALRAVNTDPQLGNRFEPLALPRWNESREFLQLLVSFERMLPLKKPSHLVEQSLSLKLLSMSEGNIGELSELLVRAAVMAVKKNHEKIDLKILESIGWYAPSQRRRASEQMV